MVVATVVALEWVQDTVSSAVKSVAERVVVSVFVVVSHIPLVMAFWFFNDSLGNLCFLVKVDWLAFSETVGWVLAWVGALVLPTTRSSVLLGEWGGAVTEVSLSDVDGRIEVDLGSWGVTSVAGKDKMSVR